MKIPFYTEKEQAMFDAIGTSTNSHDAIQSLANSNLTYLISALYVKNDLSSDDTADIIEALGDRWTENSQEVRDALLDALKHKDGLVQEYAAKGIFRFIIIKDQKTLNSIKEIELSEFDPQVQQTIRNLLGEYLKNSQTPSDTDFQENRE